MDSNLLLLLFSSYLMYLKLLNVVAVYILLLSLFHPSPSVDVVLSNLIGIGNDIPLVESWDSIP